MNHVISKSKYKEFINCSKTIWLNQYKKELKAYDKTTQMFFDRGHMVGELAQQLFAGGIDATIQDDQGQIDFGKTLGETKRLINQRTPIIYEATFNKNNKFCMADILVRHDEGSYDMYEVKSATTIKDDHLLDVAFQKTVLEENGIHLRNVFITHINPNYVRIGELSLQDLFIHENVTDLINHFVEEIPSNMHEALQILKIKEEPQVLLHPGCQGCGFQKYCMRDIPKNSVFDIAGMQFKKAIQYYHQGIITFDQVKQYGKLNSAQLVQVEHAHHSDLVIDKEHVEAFLKQLQYPICAIDFETSSDLVPLFDGFKVNEEYPFQYSLHILHRPYTKTIHKSFLGDGNSEPTLALTKQLLADIPQDAMLVAYHATTEIRFLKKLAERNPQYQEPLLALCERFIDLMDVFKSKDVYHPSMEGKYSIKTVLQALFPCDLDLAYHQLEEIHDGMEATLAWQKIVRKQVIDVDTLCTNMIAYNHLDTLAIIKLIEKLYELMLK